MDSHLISQSINHVKSDNLRWLKYADALIKGKPISSQAIPRYEDDCLSCQWLYENSEKIEAHYRHRQERDNSSNPLVYFDFDLMDEIEILRYQLHERYFEIFKIYFATLNNSIFSTLLQKVMTPSAVDEEQAKRCYIGMKQTIAELEKRLDLLESSLHEICHFNTSCAV